MRNGVPAAARVLAAAALLVSVVALQQRAGGHPDEHGRASHAHTFAAGEPGDPRKAARVVEIVMNEGPGTMTCNPDRVEVRRGEQVRFVLRNIGELRHEFMLDSFEGNAKHKVAMENNPDMVHEEPNGRQIDPKQTADLVWRFTKAGTFEFACLIPGHYETGMKGVVVVK
jgi:uncharacterized cupredoxin-like copper-binding protein